MEDENDEAALKKSGLHFGCLLKELYKLEGIEKNSNFGPRRRIMKCWIKPQL